MTFKSFSAILTAVAVLGAALPANAARQEHERPDFPVRAEAEITRQVAAESVLIGKELVRRDIDGDRLITVTVFPSSGLIDPSSRGDR
ncbi:hypothetical protein [Paracoccus seriniphilus]|uniref:hypothetical protein n=1 Tax=Paracoccus seriniphilus TaxID=184748 RepID=UPI0035647F44